MDNSEKLLSLAMLISAGFIIDGYYFLAAGVVFIFVVDVIAKNLEKRDDFEK